MQSRLRWFLLLLICVLAGLPLGSTKGFWAAEVVTASLWNVDTTRFPLIGAFLDVRDAEGRFVTGLRPDQITVLEDGSTLAVKELVELNPGAQFVIAVNPGRPFAIRNGLGYSRYDLLLEELGTWAHANAERSSDDLSLLVTDGPEALHLSSSRDWYNSLLSFNGDLREAVPSLEVLDLALEVASDPSSQPGMGRGILFITPPFEGGMAVGLQNIASRARLEGVRISVWMIASPEVFVSPAAVELQGLVEQTGGLFFAYSGIETIPDLESFIEPLRSVYQLTYTSKINTSGVHQLTVEMNSSETPVSTTPTTYDLVVQPPKAIFVSPPSLIERVFQDTSGRGQTEEASQASLLPNAQDLEIIVEFPDGYARQIITTTLIVDDVPGLIRTTPPFERLSWDLSSYINSGNHRIRVEIIDELGLMASTVENNVELTVEIPPRALMDFSGRTPMVVVFAVLLAGGVLVLVLVVLGKLSPHTLTTALRTDANRHLANRWPPARFPQLRQASPKSGPALGAAPIQDGDGRGDGSVGSWMTRLSWPQRAATPPAKAYLTPLTVTEDERTLVPVPIPDGDTCLGRDPLLAGILVEDPSVELVHARIRQEHDSYRISDEGSIAGTWVNYTPVSREGITLEHGDLVHIGKVGFRFIRREPGRVQRPVVRPEEPQ